MSITLNGKYYYVDFKYKNERLKKSTKRTNKRAAERLAAKWKEEFREQVDYGIKKNISFSKALDGYLKTHKNTGSEKSIRSRCNCLKRYFDGDLHKFGKPQLLYFLDSLGERSSATKQHYVIAMRGAMNWASERGYKSAQYNKYPFFKSHQSRVEPLTQQEEERLLAELHPSKNFDEYFENMTDEVLQQRQDNYDFVILLMDTAARYAEVAKLKWSDMDFERRQMQIYRGKSFTETPLLMTKRVKNVLMSRDQTKEYIFLAKDGTHRKYCPSAIGKAFERAGIEHYTIHKLRHSLASQLLRNKHSLDEVRVILGHKSIQTTMRYAHLVVGDEQRKALKYLDNRPIFLDPDIFDV